MKVYIVRDKNMNIMQVFRNKHKARIYAQLKKHARIMCTVEPWEVK